MVAKYRNTRCEYQGIKFDSQAEMRRYIALSLAQKSGLITELQLQVPFVLAPPVVLEGRKKPAIRYVADFVYLSDGVRIVEDAKSKFSSNLPVYRLKKHLMMHVHNIEIVEIFS